MLTACAHTWRQFTSPLRLRNASQLLSHAGQACDKSSSCQPGKACHDTALKLAIDELYDEGGAPDPLDRYPVPRVGGVEHPISKLVIKITNTLTSNNLILELMIANLLDEYPMLLFVIEGAIALGLLLFIVLWTGKGKK